MKSTKWWLGFLDWIGVANFVGPDELEKQMGDYTSQINQYSQTPESEKYWNEDFGQADYTPETQTQTQTQNTSTKTNTGDILSKILGIPGL